MTISNDTAAPAGMLKYALIFGLMILFCQVLVVLVTSFLKFETPAAMGIIVIVLSLAAAMQKFAADTKRAPLSSERLSLATLGGIVAVIVTAGLQALSALVLKMAGGSDAVTEVVREMTGGSASPALVFALLAVLIFVMTWVLIFLSAGFFARSALKRIARAK